MTEEEWNICTSPKEMLTLIVERDTWKTLKDLASDRPFDRKLALAAVAFCRRISTHFFSQQSRRILELAEQVAERHASRDELLIASKALEADWPIWCGNHEASHALKSLSIVACGNPRSHVASYVSRHAALAAKGAEDVEQKVQCEILRDVLGPLLFREVRIEPAWLTPTVVSFATDIYELRSFERVPELGRALGEAGCTNQEVLGHCVPGKAHARGCWVVDLLLRKQ